MYKPVQEDKYTSESHNKTHNKVCSIAMPLEGFDPRQGSKLRNHTHLQAKERFPALLRTQRKVLRKQRAVQNTPRKRNRTF